MEKKYSVAELASVKPAIAGTEFLLDQFEFKHLNDKGQLSRCDSPDSLGLSSAAWHTFHFLKGRYWLTSVALLSWQAKFCLTASFVSGSVVACITNHAIPILAGTQYLHMHIQTCGCCCSQTLLFYKHMYVLPMV